MKIAAILLAFGFVALLAAPWGAMQALGAVLMGAAYLASGAPMPRRSNRPYDHQIKAQATREYARERRMRERDANQYLADAAATREAVRRILAK